LAVVLIPRFFSEFSIISQKGCALSHWPRVCFWEGAPPISEQSEMENHSCPS
jgi:hypothetical protein